RLREFARVQIVGEVVNLRPPTRSRVYFELRDERGAIPCAMWRADLEQLKLGADVLREGAQVVVAGGCDYYPGSSTSSPSFSFCVTDVRAAGEGDLLARIERLRKALALEGLFEPQKRLDRTALPRTIGVITGEGGKARDDIRAGLARRGWGGRLVWAFAPVQDRHAAPSITRALVDLAALEGMDAIVIARGGGSLADLLAFCDETLCRTVALLRVPVIASVGHHTDRTLLDEVAAVSCSTPTHAAEAAVPLHCGQARDELIANSRRLTLHSDRAVLTRARALARLARAPAQHVAAQVAALHQSAREMRASARRTLGEERSFTARRLLVVSRKAEVAGLSRARAGRELASSAQRLERGGRMGCAARRRELDRLLLALDAHHPQRTLARGYALVEDAAGEPVASARAARRARDVRVRFADAVVPATIGDVAPTESDEPL
ncbi:MAG TPA: exodeoxyribonuclease VII large subunit, partial [Solirubrobacteraceae bacterium]|nr:exodeoxyribonuclease VII large subunit [Solirubrobacteraceae bacterium]